MWLFRTIKSWSRKGILNSLVLVKHYENFSFNQNVVNHVKIVVVSVTHTGLACTKDFRFDKRAISNNLNDGPRSNRPRIRHSLNCCVQFCQEVGWLRVKNLPVPVGSNTTQFGI